MYRHGDSLRGVRVSIQAICAAVTLSAATVQAVFVGLTVKELREASRLRVAAVRRNGEQR